ncbi:MAG: DUF2304 domain-containing protein [Candidatus Dormibacteria bacterium]|jgi:hypothetical protein
MTPRIRLIVLAITFICLLLITRQVRRRQMRASYLLIWTALTLVVIGLIAFPQGVDTISGWLGIYYPPATIFLAATVILFLISIHFSRQLTRLEERTRILAEELALLRLERSEPPPPAPRLPAESAMEAVDDAPPGAMVQPASFIDR